MFGENCRRPCLYTRSKSECFSNRPKRDKPRGKPAPAFAAGRFTLLFGASALTSSHSCTNDGLCCPWWENLVAETRFHCYTLASLGPAAREHSGPALGLHASPEPVLLRALAFVRLKCTFRHRKSLLLIESAGLRQTVSINDARQMRQTGETGMRLSLDLLERTSTRLECLCESR
jgi:hypothetical protein